MNDTADSAVQAAEDEGLNTTVPNLDVEVWKMPEPIFRKTSGRLPKPFESKFDPADAATPDAPVIDPPSSAVQAPEPRPKSPALKLVIVALALAAMIAFIAVFLTVVYFFFLR